MHIDAKINAEQDWQLYICLPLCVCECKAKAQGYVEAEGEQGGRVKGRDTRQRF